MYSIYSYALNAHRLRNLHNTINIRILYIFTPFVCSTYMYVNSVSIAEQQQQKQCYNAHGSSSVTSQDLSPTGQKFYPTGIGFLQQRYHLSPSSHQPIPVRQHSSPRLRMKLQTLFHSFHLFISIIVSFVHGLAYCAPARTSSAPGTNYNKRELYIFYIIRMLYVYIIRVCTTRTNTIHVQADLSIVGRVKPSPGRLLLFTRFSTSYISSSSLSSLIFLHLLWPPLFLTVGGNVCILFIRVQCTLDVSKSFFQGERVAYNEKVIISYKITEPPGF